MPQVSLLSLPSWIICVKLDDSAGAGGEKQRIVSFSSGEGLEILNSSFIKGIQRDFCWVRTECSSGRKAADWKSNPFFLMQLLIGFKLTASVAIDFYQRPLHGTY